MSQSLPEIPQIKVSHVTSKDDFVELVEVEHNAFTSSPVMALAFAESPSSSPRATMETNIRKHQSMWSTDPTARYLKATLPDGKIVGMAKWNFLDAGATPQNYLDGELPPGANKEMCEYFINSIDKARTDAMGGKRHFLMTILCVSPEYQRMGIGVKLLEWGLQEADREGVECWIDSIPFGLGLYKKFAWKEVGYTEVDLGNWGGEQGKLSRTVHLVRAPQGKGVS